MEGSLGAGSLNRAECAGYALCRPGQEAHGVRSPVLSALRIEGEMPFERTARPAAGGESCEAGFFLQEDRRLAETA